MIEAGNKMFSLPGSNIPDWFAHRTSGESISFWFRNKFPAISLCLVIGQEDELPISVKFSPKVLINGNELSGGNQKVYKFRIATDHILLFDARMLSFEDNGDTELSDYEWNHVVVSYEDLITDNGVPIRVVAKYSGIHVFKQTSGLEDIQFTNPRKTFINANLGPNSMAEPPQRETSESLSNNEVYATLKENDPPVIHGCSVDEDADLDAVSCEEESSSNTEGSDSDDPFDLINRKLCVSWKKIISSGSSSGDANLRSISEAINALELLMVKDLSEVSSDPAAHSKLHQLLDLLGASSHPKVTVEMKEAIVEFKRKAFLLFQQFQSTVESVKTLKDFEKHLTRIKQETVEGKSRRKDLKNSIKRVSLGIKAENSSKKELESEIAVLRKQLATKERDLEQFVVNLKNQEETLSTYSTSYASLNEQAQSLLKQADDLLAVSSGIKDEGEAAEVEQSRLRWTWSIDLTGQLNQMKKNILGF